MSLDEWLSRIPPDSDAFLPWLDEGWALTDGNLALLADTIKNHSGTLLNIDIIRAEHVARALVALGTHRADENALALGEMALGDALRLQLKLAEGYQLLDSAAERFRTLGNEVGWARTRIGWIGHLHFFDEIDDPFPIVEEVAAIFARGEHWLWYSLTCNNYVFYLLNVGKTASILRWAHHQLDAAQRLPPDAISPRLYAEMALVEAHTTLGQRNEAESHATSLQALLEQNELPDDLQMLAKRSLGRFYINFGRYTQGLAALDVGTSTLLPSRALIHYQLLARCYLHLRRFDQAEAWLRRVLDITTEQPDLRDHDEYARQGLVHVLRARGQVDDALAMIAGIRDLQGSSTSGGWRSELLSDWLYLAHQAGLQEEVKRLRALIRQQSEASNVAFSAAQGFLAIAATSDDPAEKQEALDAARARCEQLPWLRWRIFHTTAHLAATVEGRIEHLEQAAADLDETQNWLVTSIQAGFLEEAEQVYHDLIAAYLECGDIERAWQGVERSKSRALMNARRFREGRDDIPRSRREERLHELSEQQFALLNAVREGTGDAAELGAVEEEMRTLYQTIDVEVAASRHAAYDDKPFVPTAPPGHTLVGFYVVRDEVHAFLHDGERYSHYRLPTTPNDLATRLNALYLYLVSTTRIPPGFFEQSHKQVDAVLARLGRWLIEPLVPALDVGRRLTIVPYGDLHQLPFHLLRWDGAYLLERFDLRIVPTAQLADADDTDSLHEPRHLSVSHDWQGRLRYTEAEARLVADTLGEGVHLMAQHQATRAALLKQLRGRVGVCHIAAHGESRLDRPMLSHLFLDDGILTIGDLLSHVLQACLVTLSACETGRIALRPGDEPMSLAHAFLAAGARSLLVSLWDLDDEAALAMMEQFYRLLAAGQTKADALRAVWMAWINHPDPRLRHPYFWGALHLIGNGGLL